MVDRRFIEVHGMFFFPRVVRILEGPLYDSISVYLKTSVIHYKKYVANKPNIQYQEEQIELHLEKFSQTIITINKQLAVDL